MFQAERIRPYMNPCHEPVVYGLINGTLGPNFMVNQPGSKMAMGAYMDVYHQPFERLGSAGVRLSPTKTVVSLKTVFCLEANKTWPWVKTQIVPPVNIQIPTQIGSKMGGAPLPQNGTIGFDPQPHETQSEVILLCQPQTSRKRDPERETSSSQSYIASESAKLGPYSLPGRCAQSGLALLGRT